jgi:integrase
MKTENARAAFMEAKRGYSPRTLEQYNRALDYLESECQLLPDKPGIIRAMLNRIDSVWVRHGYWVVWRMFFRWCKAEYNLPDPMDRVEKPKLPKVEMSSLGIEELARVWAAADSTQEKCIVALSLGSGVRASEFGRIKVGDVGDDRIKIHGKGNKFASVPISVETRQLLQALIDHTGGMWESLLFTGDEGEPLSRFQVYRIVRRCMDRAGIKGTKRGSHCLRHSLGRNWIASGGDSVVLKQIMRHSDMETTEKYINLSLQDVIRAHHLYSPLANLPGMKVAQSVRVADSIDAQELKAYYNDLAAVVNRNQLLNTEGLLHFEQMIELILQVLDTLLLPEAAIDLINEALGHLREES